MLLLLFIKNSLHLVELRFSFFLFVLMEFRLDFLFNEFALFALLLGFDDLLLFFFFVLSLGKLLGREIKLGAGVAQVAD